VPRRSIQERQAVPDRLEINGPNLLCIGDPTKSASDLNLPNTCAKESFPAGGLKIGSRRNIIPLHPLKRFWIPLTDGSSFW